MPLLKAMSALALPQVVTYIVSILIDTRLTAYFPQQPGQASIRKFKPIWILMKQEMIRRQ